MNMDKRTHWMTLLLILPRQSAHLSQGPWVHKGAIANPWLLPIMGCSGVFVQGSRCCLMQFCTYTGLPISEKVGNSRDFCCNHVFTSVCSTSTSCMELHVDMLNLVPNGISFLFTAWKKEEKSVFIYRDIQIFLSKEIYENSWYNVVMPEN